MIHPNMATMLAFIFTDAAVAPSLLDRALTEASSGTFEAISVDGDTSTNDTVFLLAGGASGLTVRARDRSFDRFLESLRIVCDSLARQIVEDGEGARRAMEITVKGARDAAGARTVARAVAVSPLVKTALAGGDANWGRILSAAGASGAAFDPGRVTVEIAGIAVARRGAAVDHDRRRVEKAFRARRVPVVITLGRGPGASSMTTCDLTEEYVRINADYRS
jgi:glutamate N-acetyltransferase/amino-acid N-acetyltransferase